MPFGTYKNAMRKGADAVAANAGVIASRTGSAMAAPMPCNIARLESRLPGFMRSSLHSLSHLERRALYDREDQTRELILSGCRLPADCFHHRRILAFQPAAQCERQHLLRDVP